MSIQGAHRRQIAGLWVLILVQAACALLFLYDLLRDLIEARGLAGIHTQLVIETVASIALVIGIAVETRIMRAMYRRQWQSERSMRVARGAFHRVIEDYYDGWRLSPAERDVAGFLIKGCSIAEIAGFRNAAEGTVKTQLNAVYRKAGIAGRSQLVSLLIEDLLAKPLVEEADGAADGAADKGAGGEPNR